MSFSLVLLTSVRGLSPLFVSSVHEHRAIFHTFGVDDGVVKS